MLTIFDTLPIADDYSRLLWHRPVQEAKAVLLQMFFISHFGYDLPV
jgi:hypothetical protein